MIDVIRHAMNGTQGRNYRWQNCPRWAVCNQGGGLLPEAVLRRRSLGLRAEKSARCVPTTSYRGEQTATSILKQRTRNIAPTTFTIKPEPTTEDGGQHCRGSSSPH